ncbi:hypothetical protein [Xanthomonas citri]
MDRSDIQVSDLLVLELQGFHDAYGNGPDFWDAYQRIMGIAAQGLGATKRAQLL